MGKLKNIETRLTRVLMNNSEYDSDYKRCINFIRAREFESLDLLVGSIIQMEERKEEDTRIVNYPLLIEAKVMIQEYIEGLLYEGAN